MGKFFDGVKDPERAGNGDIVVFPANERRLDLGSSTFRKLGLSLGYTCRSANDRDTVISWMCRGGTERPKAFLLTGCQSRLAPSGDELLLGLDATAEPASADPTIAVAMLVPFGPAGGGWDMSKWAACWDVTYGGAVRSRLAGLVRDVAIRAPRWRSDDARDVFAGQVWDGESVCAKHRPLEACDSRSWFPSSGNGATTEGSFNMPSLMSWSGDSWSSRSSRIRFSSGFLTQLAARGALVLRPSAAFVRDVTDEIAMWACGVLAKRFGTRIAASDHYMKGLKADIVRDRGRMRSLLSAKRRTEAAARRAASVRRVAGMEVAQ